MDELWEVIVRQQVAGMIQPHFNDAAFSARWPKPLLARVEQTFVRQHQRRVRLIASYRELAANLRQHRVDVIFLKGLLFAQRYYGDIHQRRAHDIDILVQERQLAQCVSSLEALGYTLPQPRSKALSRHTLRQEHAITLQRGDDEVDVHWRFRNSHCRHVRKQPIIIKLLYRLDYAEIWQAQAQCGWQGIEFPVLTPEYDLLLLLLSMAQDLDRAACRVRHAVDVWQILGHMHERTDWRTWLERRKHERTLRSCVNVLDLVLRWFNGRDRFPALATALADHKDLIVEKDDKRALQLLAGERNNAVNQAWFTRVHPTWQWNGVLRLLHRAVSQPGRLPWLVFKQFKRRAG